MVLFLCRNAWILVFGSLCEALGIAFESRVQRRISSPFRPGGMNMMMASWQPLPQRPASNSTVRRKSPTRRKLLRKLHFESPFVLVDATGLFYRCTHAIKNVGTYMSEGKDVSGLWSFARSLLRVRKDFHPRYICAVFDAEDSRDVRNQIYPAYKANRPDNEVNRSIKQQIPYGVDFCKQEGMVVVSEPGVEADDVIGSICSTFSALISEGKVPEVDSLVIVSQDKDMRQLLCLPHTYLCIPQDKYRVHTAEDVKRDFGVMPDQFAAWQALVGDTVDNIPGVPRLGPKRAARLLVEHEDINVMLAVLFLSTSSWR
eukprot:GHVU01088036.1.p1 GENE.GHVU01088036.1~~GHVU01088036.1.p1  ORF type:complete len:315 (-),score=17.69 GHVU01088036.1:1151-2095(-)